MIDSQTKAMDILNAKLKACDEFSKSDDYSHLINQPIEVAVRLAYGYGFYEGAHL